MVTQYCDLYPSSILSHFIRLYYRMSELIEIRYRSPWLWPDALFNLTSFGRETRKCLEIVHGFTNKVGQSELM